MDNGYYLYAIMKDKAFSNGIVGGAGIHPDHATESISEAGLAAIVSAVPLSEFGKESLAANIQDLKWLESRARAHDSIVRHLTMHATIVPVRFGTVYFTKDNVRQWLACENQHLNAVLKALEGLWEMGVALYFDKCLVAELAGKDNQDIQSLEEKISQASPGTAYLLQRKLDTSRAALLETFVHQQVQDAMETLKGFSKTVKQGALAPFPNDENMLYINLACLIDKEQIELFKTYVGSYQERLGQGMTLRVTGPWPAYSFSSLAHEMS